MQANVIGRVRNTPLAKTQGLLPLYEAIINSIDSIEETSGSTPSGSIDISILRHYGLAIGTDDHEQSNLAPIRGFIIHDNGIGFNNENFRSFNEADTQFKESKGGKGVGRFIWLKAFQKVEVESVFMEGDEYYFRKFDFSLSTPEGVQNHEIKPLTSPESVHTIVRLLDFRADYEERVPHNAQIIAQRIVEHCLEYLLLGRFPRISLHEENEDQVIDLEGVYLKLVETVEQDRFEVGEHHFDITHIKIHGHSDILHQLHFCANERVAKSVKLAGKVPNLGSNFQADEGEPWVYAGYVSSDYLNTHVNLQRTDFDTLHEDGFQIPGEIKWQEIENNAINASKIFLQPFTETIRIDKEERIRQYVDENAPEFKYLVSHHSEMLDNISPDITDEKLNVQLYEIQRNVELDLRK